MLQRTKHIKRADRWFKRFVRLSHASSSFHCVCCTCEVRMPILDAVAGHYVDAAVLATRWHEQNVHPQCDACNRHKSGSKVEYADFIIRRYGHDVLDCLHDENRRRKQQKHKSVCWYQELAEFAKDACLKEAGRLNVDIVEKFNWR